MMDGQPNGWAALIAAITMLGTIGTTIVTYLLTRRGQDPKLDQIHEQVNGKSQAQEQRIAELEALVEDLQRKPQ